MVQQYFVKKSPVKSVKTSRAKVKKSPKKFSKTPRNPLLSPMLQRRLFRMSDSQSPVRKSPVRKSPARKRPVKAQFRMYDWMESKEFEVNRRNLDELLEKYTRIYDTLRIRNIRSLNDPILMQRIADASHAEIREPISWDSLSLLIPDVKNFKNAPPEVMRKLIHLDNLQGKIRTLYLWSMQRNDAEVPYPRLPSFADWTARRR